MSEINHDPLEIMRKPFPKHQISRLPKPYKKDSPKGNCDVCGGYHGLPAVHLEYVGHAALTDRLLDADPHWKWEPLALDADGLPKFDKNGGLWIKLTVGGVMRLGYGNAEDSEYKDSGAREKEVIGDALRNAAMRFGAALDLWHKGDLHGDKKEQSADAPKTPYKPQGEELTNHAPKAPQRTSSMAMGLPQPPEDLGRYVVRVGKKFKGQELGKIPDSEAIGYRDWLVSDAKKTGKPLTPDAQQYVDVVDAYHKLPKPKDSDEIPF